MLRAITGVITMCLLLAACSSHDPFLNDPYKKELASRKLGIGKYIISLPENYKIKVGGSIDFDVYYFYPRDTADKTSFRGGIYFGNFPRAFHVDSSKCKPDNIQSPILGEEKTWDLFSCGTHYFTQTLISSKSGESWDDKIHAFGRAATKPELHKLMIVFSTLQKR